MTKQRVYNEPKAKRTLVHQNTLIRKLQKSLNNRQEKEKFWNNEIKAIDTAYVNIKCKSCGDCIQVKFKDWQNGKYERICRRCMQKHLKQELTDIYNKVQLVLPEGYIIHQSGFDNQLIIRKKDK